MKTEESKIRQAALAARRVDTHGHLRGQIPLFETQAVERETLDGREGYFNLTVCGAGCKALYGVDVGPVLTKDAPREVFERAAALRALGRDAALEHTFKVANIETQLCFCDFRGSDAADKRAMAPHVRLLAYIDQALIGAPVEGQSYIERLEVVHGPLGSISDLLSSIDRQIDAWRALGVVGMKVSLAYYDRGLDLASPTAAEAALAFAKRGAMTTDDIRLVRDFGLRHAFDACLRNRFPVVFHTGYQAFGTANIMAANPALLMPVFVNPRWRDLTFVILHGGYPYTGETGFLAGRCPNVVIDFTWLTFLSPVRFKQALGEWLSLVPLTRFVWGSDSGINPESIAGIDRLSRGLIADVLEQAVKDGWMDEARALRFIELCYRENARRIFQL